MITVSLTINKKEYTCEIDPQTTLLELLREHLGLTGTKRGCEIGECGACTVIMDGLTVNSCLVPAFQADGSDITTIEGIASNGKLHPVQEAFLEYDAVHCGFCTPGMVLSAVNLLDNNPQPSQEDIRRALAGNLCRCTGYQQIFDAVQAASKKMKSKR
ncbi:MAG TPA: (2Fe-2S)-binding protein [Caldithrix abyssi]|uniref:(2Fe-2S)-binding protein n=1 Tax=Caldithrix abyssi TaxID=187145 RepID=A0A7V4TZH4_CALAY|nr:(2Fe-2S)-binding protein [Caldithrix abyssi]